MFFVAKMTCAYDKLLIFDALRVICEMAVQIDQPIHKSGHMIQIISPSLH